MTSASENATQRTSLAYSASKDADIAKLRAENQALSEELSQCQADKDFVWSLWKRLQVANPDVSQAISLVLQREKEKTEMKDRKVLEILHIKDDRIADLERLEKEHEEESVKVKESIKKFQESRDKFEADRASLVAEKESLTSEKESLTSEKDKLVAEIEQVKSKFEESTSDLKYQVTEKHQECERLLKENSELKRQLDSYSVSVQESREELDRSDRQNAHLLAKIKELEVDLARIGKTAERAANEHEFSDIELEETKKQRDQWKEVATTMEKDLNKLRKKFLEMKKNYQKTVEQTTEQLQVITQLQSLQTETQTILKTQENAHVIEASNYLAMNKELQARFEAVQESEQNLQRILSDPHSQRSKKNLTEAAVQTTELTDKNIESPWTERFSKQSNIAIDSDVAMKHDISVSSLKRRRTKSLSPQRSRALFKKGQMIKSGGSHDGDDEDELLSHDRRKLKDLKKLLRLKEEELTQMRSAHHGRLTRLQSLQSAYNVVKEQIQTYEQHSGKKKKKVTYRADPRLLQKEDSDAVWNELTYYKQRTAEILQEKMNLEEELDRLKVQTASDACTIEDLALCLQEDKKEMQFQMKKLKEMKRKEEKERDRAKKSESSLENLQAELLHSRQAVEEMEIKVNDLKSRCTEAEREARKLKAQCSKLESEGVLKASHVEMLQSEVVSLKRKLHHKQESSKVARRSRSQTSLKEHQLALNKSIEKMSHIFPNLSYKDWEEVSSWSGDDTGRISTGFVTSTPRRRPREGARARRRHLRAQSWDSSFQQLSSVQKHLMRMARAYEQKPAGVVIHKELVNMSTQTDDDYSPALSRADVVDAGVGDIDIRSETSTNASESEGSVTHHSASAFSVSSFEQGASDLPSATLLGKTQSSPSLKSRNHVRSLQKRVSTLQQQVTLLKSSKSSLQKNYEDQVRSVERLNTDLVQATHQLQMSRQTTQRLTRQLEDSKSEASSLRKEVEEMRQKEEGDKRSVVVHKHMEDRLKGQAEEIVCQGSTIKGLKEDLKTQMETIKSLQEKISRLDKDNSQKRALIEDLRAKAKAIEEQSWGSKDEVEALTKKLQQYDKESGMKRTEAQSLKKQLAVVRKEKLHYEQLWTDTKTQLEKQKSLLEISRNKQLEAENSLMELESVASEQLQTLTEHSEQALRAARSELHHLRTKINQLQELIVDLTKETQKHMKDLKRRSEEAKSTDPMSAREQSLAASLLNLSADDWQGFMEDPPKGTTNRGTQLDGEISELRILLNAQVLNNQNLMQFFHENVLTGR